VCRLCIIIATVSAHVLNFWVTSHPGRSTLDGSFRKQIDHLVSAQIHQNRAEFAPPFKRSGKGNDVAIVPSPKNRAGHFRSTRLKPFIPPVLPDAVSPRGNPGYELADDRWDEAGPDFLPDLILLWIARAHDDYAIR
jgi:hypothetical protein